MKDEEAKPEEAKTCKFIVPMICDWQMCTDPSHCQFIDEHGKCHRPQDVKTCPIDDEMLESSKRGQQLAALADAEHHADESEFFRKGFKGN